jgi:hypothetical protein
MPIESFDKSDLVKQVEQVFYECFVDDGVVSSDPSFDADMRMLSSIYTEFLLQDSLPNLTLKTLE